MKNEKSSSRLSRREFLGGAAAAAFAFTYVPREVFGANEKLNVAGVGIGGMGKSNVRGCKSENIVALCDVDADYASGAFKEFPKAKVWTDFRKMLDAQKEIDAVIVATPDNTHAVVAMAAMKRGKGVYVQKPLTRTVYEARMLTEAARKYKVASQMGNQGHSGEGVRRICEWIWDGAIGEVREVHAWTNRPVWPQGISKRPPAQPVKDGLDWDMWVGPSPMRPYNDAYLPFKWRGWWDFGGGALADMACHVIDPVFWALKLKYPTSVVADAEGVNNETFPKASTVKYEFPAREGMPAVTLNWYDGGRKPPRPAALEAGRDLDQASSNVLFIGSKGVLRCGEYGDSPRLIPETSMKAYKRPEKSLPRVGAGHEMDWVRACKGGQAACSNFDYSGPLTETVVMGNLALRPEVVGKKLLWDGENMKVTNNEVANGYVNLPSRKGWDLEDM